MAENSLGGQIYCYITEHIQEKNPIRVIHVEKVSHSLDLSKLTKGYILVKCRISARTALKGFFEISKNISIKYQDGRRKI